MAKIALITEKQYKPGINEIGDIAGDFSDDQPIQQKCLDDFDWIYDIEEDDLRSSMPEVKRIYKSKVSEWTEEPPEIKYVWVDPTDRKAKEVVNDPKYKLHYDVKEGKITHTYDRDESNLVEIDFV